MSWGLVAGMVALAAGCSSSSSSSSGGTMDSGGGGQDATQDTSSGEGGTTSACGHAGDMGNTMGVGKYCVDSTTCPATAPICSSINNGSEPANMQTFFCVLPCTACSPPGYCGPGASCVCSAPGCGCTPDSCTALATDAGTPQCTVDSGSEAAAEGGGGNEAGADAAGD